MMNGITHRVTTISRQNEASIDEALASTTHLSTMAKGMREMLQ